MQPTLMKRAKARPKTKIAAGSPDDVALGAIIAGILREHRSIRDAVHENPALRHLAEALDEPGPLRTFTEFLKRAKAIERNEARSRQRTRALSPSGLSTAEWKARLVDRNRMLGALVEKHFVAGAKLDGGAGGAYLLALKELSESGFLANVTDARRAHSAHLASLALNDLFAPAFTPDGKLRRHQRRKKRPKA